MYEIIHIYRDGNILGKRIKSIQPAVTQLLEAVQQVKKGIPKQIKFIRGKRVLLQAELDELIGAKFLEVVMLAGSIDKLSIRFSSPTAIGNRAKTFNEIDSRKVTVCWYNIETGSNDFQYSWAVDSE